jgi:hypothetical protein
MMLVWPTRSTQMAIGCGQGGKNLVANVEMAKA